MTERLTKSSVLKCTVFVHPSVKQPERALGAKKWKGVTAAMQFVSVLSIMCVTGESLGCGEEDALLLPEHLRGYSAHKYFLDGSPEHSIVMGFIQGSRRVEFRLKMFGPIDVSVTAHFFKKGKEESGRLEMIFSIFTGDYRNGSITCY